MEEKKCYIYSVVSSITCLEVYIVKPCDLMMVVYSLCTLTLLWLATVVLIGKQASHSPGCTFDIDTSFAAWA